MSIHLIQANVFAGPSGRIHFLSLEPNKCAEALTVIEKRLFTAIQPGKHTSITVIQYHVTQLSVHRADIYIHTDEWLSGAWGKSPEVREARCPNLSRIIQHFNRVSYWAASEV